MKLYDALLKSMRLNGNLGMIRHKMHMYAIVVIASVWQAMEVSSSQTARVKDAATSQRKLRQEPRSLPCQYAFIQMGETVPSVWLGACRHQVPHLISYSLLRHAR